MRVGNWPGKIFQRQRLALAGEKVADDGEADFGITPLFEPNDRSPRLRRQVAVLGIQRRDCSPKISFARALPEGGWRGG